MTPVHTVLDATVVTGAAAVTTISTLILASTDRVTTMDLQLLLLPMLGGVLVGGAFIMLNPAPDTRTITIGRSILGLFFGTLAPQAAALFHPSLSEFAVKPVVLLLFGGIATALTYLLSKPFTREMYLRADRVAKAQADKLEEKYSKSSHNENS